MLSIFRRSKQHKFNIASIGENWLVRPLTHDNIPGKLHVRQLPSDVPRNHFPIVALAWTDKAEQTLEADSLSLSVRQTLEREGNCLLVLVHETPDRLTWYAYAASSKALDGAFASLSNEKLRWGVNEDRGWLEYEHAKNLVGA